MDEPEDWKHAVLEDFRIWLAGAPDDWRPLDGTEGEEDDATDLRALFAELAALRQEVRLQNREQARAGRELGKATGLFESVAGIAQRPREELAALEERTARRAEAEPIAAFLEVRDALERGQEAVRQLRDGLPIWIMGPQRFDAVAEGYALAIRRFDRVLARFRVERVAAEGRPFDSRVMHAVEVRRNAAEADGVVLEEIVAGYVRDGLPLRLSEVAVNRLNEGV